MSRLANIQQMKNETGCREDAVLGDRPLSLGRTMGGEVLPAIGPPCKSVLPADWRSVEAFGGAVLKVA
jgi:hypothetical protein